MNSQFAWNIYLSCNFNATLFWSSLLLTKNRKFHVARFPLHIRFSFLRGNESHVTNDLIMKYTICLYSQPSIQGDPKNRRLVSRGAMNRGRCELGKYWFWHATSRPYFALKTQNLSLIIRDWILKHIYSFKLNNENQLYSFTLLYFCSQRMPNFMWQGFHSM